MDSYHLDISYSEIRIQPINPAGVPCCEMFMLNYTVLSNRMGLCVMKEIGFLI